MCKPVRHVTHVMHTWAAGVDSHMLALIPVLELFFSCLNIALWSAPLTALIPHTTPAPSILACIGAQRSICTRSGKTLEKSIMTHIVASLVDMA
jgi:hypothetical protein